MLLLLLPQHKGEPFFEELYTSGAKGGTVVFGHRPPINKLSYILCLGDEPVELLQLLANDEEYPILINAIKHNRLLKKMKLAHLYVIPTSKRYKEKDMTKTGQLISVIVTRGYADDVMAVARGAGAGGGSIIHARGTGKKEDEKFFGITIVPEKEQLFIAANNEKAEQIKNAIKGMEILHKPGMGILFALPIEEYVNLGKIGEEE